MTVRKERNAEESKPKRRERGTKVQFWLLPELADPMRERAKAAGLCLSAWVRHTAVKQLRREPSL